MKTIIDEQTDNGDLLDIKAVARIVGVTPKSIWRWVRDGEIVKPVRVGRRLLRWRQNDLRTWIQNGCTAPNNE